MTRFLSKVSNTKKGATAKGGSSFVVDGEGIDPRTMTEEQVAEYNNKHGKPKTGLALIRRMCLDCCHEQHKEVLLCPVEDCPLWLFRMGEKPPSMRKEKK